MSRSTLAAFLVLAALAVAAPVRAQEAIDSTRVEAWRLPNGLEVRVRHVPGAAGAAVALAYRAGDLHVPAARTGLAPLLAELQFTAAAGDVPERTRDEMPSLRPRGWDVRTNDHVALFVELASRAQLPGVLQQVAARAHGVQPGDSCFARALRQVRGTLASGMFGDPNMVLYKRIKSIAGGADDAQLLAMASGRGLAGLTLAEATAELRRLYVPANATLALAGDFTGIDLHNVVQDLFGNIPAGTAEKDAAPRPLSGSWRSGTLAGLAAPLGVVGAIAPALEDTLHPSFYVAALLAGGFWYEHGGKPQPPLGSGFQYNVLEDPTLVRFNVPPGKPFESAQQVLDSWKEAMLDLRDYVFVTSVIESTKASVDWLIGGPIPPAVRRLCRRDISPLSTIATSMASRATWRGDGFWDAYRVRFERSRIAPLQFVDWMLAPEHQSALLLQPRP